MEWAYQHPRADRHIHLHGGISEWRGHHYAGTRCIFLFKASAVLPNGGITNTQGQNTRSSHLPSGMCEWRGHHFASGHAVLVKDICAVVAGQCGDLHALTKGPRTAVVCRTVLVHVQPRECESQLVCGRTTQTGLASKNSVGGLWELAVE